MGKKMKTTPAIKVAKKPAPSSKVWSSSVTQAMIDSADLNHNEISLLINALNDSVMELCQAYGIEG
jgi:hypothetical protein